ncbi:phosphotransferase [Caballeronia ptereochthonis]|uniref:phosphotransferase n=1 Tax=Caballeronia ptereochthonis TaxID=1777144 RepID=UPI000A91E08E|nr:phosphotransferase [Caballeronia ptereochthonis]
MPDTPRKRGGRHHLRAVDAAMRRPRTYPHPAGRIERIETHISLVYLAGRFAYKIKKPVDLGFLDFSRASARRRACEDEYRLNRRLAPRIYLRVVSLVRRGRGFLIGRAGDAVEYAVMMRRFDGKRILAALLKAGALDGRILENTARCIASFHRATPHAPPDRLYGSASLFAGQLRAVLESLHREALGAVSNDLTTWCEAELRRLGTFFDARRAQGFVRECHGDLHLQNIVLQGAKPVIFDCIEFDGALRWIDVVSDLASPRHGSRGARLRRAGGTRVDCMASRDRRLRGLAGVAALYRLSGARASAGRDIEIARCRCAALFGPGIANGARLVTVPAALSWLLGLRKISRERESRAADRRGAPRQ